MNKLIIDQCSKYLPSFPPVFGAVLGALFVVYLFNRILECCKGKPRVADSVKISPKDVIDAENNKGVSLYKRQIQEDECVSENDLFRLNMDILECIFRYFNFNEKRTLRLVCGFFNHLYKTTVIERTIELKNPTEVEHLCNTLQTFETSDGKIPVVKIVFNFDIDRDSYKLTKPLIEGALIFKCNSIKSLGFKGGVDRELGISSFSQLSHLSCGNLRSSLRFDKLEHLTTLNLLSRNGMNNYFDLNKDKLPNLKEIILDLSNCLASIELPVLEKLYVCGLYCGNGSVSKTIIKAGNDNLKTIHIPEARDHECELIIEGPLPSLITLELPGNINCSAESLNLNNFPSLEEFSYSGESYANKNMISLAKALAQRKALTN